MPAGELTYTPVLGEAEAIIASFSPDELLVVGGDLPVGAHQSPAIRLEPSQATLWEGCYQFDGEIKQLMVVRRGLGRADPVSQRWDDDPDSSLLLAHAWFLNLWQGAQVVPDPSYRPNDVVQLKPDMQRGIVQALQYESGEWYFEVSTGDGVREYRANALRAAAEESGPDSWIGGTPSSAADLAATLTRAKLSQHLTDTVYSFRASRTVFRPYQFRPILRLLESGRHRILIADEVGLGKTIEAGLVWTELDARRQADRVLVVCPSVLCEKWQAEMRERFGYDVRRLKRDGLDEMLDAIEFDRFPRRFAAVTSVEGMRVWDGLERFAELSPRFDLVVVDEAHVFRNSDTKSHALGTVLSECADALVFLSATPLNLGNSDLFNLLQLLAPTDFEDRQVLEYRLQPNAVLNRVSRSLIDRDVGSLQRLSWLDQLDDLVFGKGIVRRAECQQLRQLLHEDRLTPADIVTARRLISRLHALSAVVTRTRKVEIQEAMAVREATRVDVEWSDAEQHFYDEFRQWIVNWAYAHGFPVGFATQMPLRLASTCLQVAKQRVLQDRSPDDLDLNEPWLGSSPPPAASQPITSCWLEPRPPELIASAEALDDVDTKFDRFAEHLRPLVAAGHQVLVFSHSRRAIGYLHRRLAEQVRCQVMHGGVAPADRPALIQSFRNGEFDVLLANRVASEGLDFEFCSVVVNYDLPWNPMEVEQRIGRIDRIGQEHEKIKILNFHTPGTIETDIIQRVHDRIGVFHDSVGELEPILQSRLNRLRTDTFDFTLSTEERQRRLDESLAAIEGQHEALDEVETASAFLASTDGADIDGLAGELEESGRYIGQMELVLLVTEWAYRVTGQRPRVSADGLWFELRGQAGLDRDLQRVQAKGERSATEIDQLSRDLRNEADITISLDPDTARKTGASLLAANHPLVRAALLTGDGTPARFGSVRLSDSGLPSGSYLVLISLARWTGVQASAKVWTTAVPFDGSPNPDAVGPALLASLATAGWGDSTPPSDRAATTEALRTGQRLVRRRQATEEDDLQEENQNLSHTRQLSIEEGFKRKRSIIAQRLATARSNAQPTAVRLQQAQLDRQAASEAEAIRKLEDAMSGHLSVEPIAVFHVEVAS